MPVVTVVPSIGPYDTPQGGYELSLRSDTTRQAWGKWYERNDYAYKDALDLGVATEEHFQGTPAPRIRLKTEATIDTERLNLFGLRETNF